MARLIIVEDNTELAFLIASAAKARGHEARAVHAGQAALHALGAGAFDAAVVDLLLPDMGGAEVLDALRQRGIPAVAISGVYKGETFALEAVEQHGAARFFEKPFEMRALLEAVETAAGAPQDALIVEDDEDDLAELEVLTPLEEDDGGEPDEPMLPVSRPPVPELDDEPSTPTRPLEEVELAALVKGTAEQEPSAELGPEEQTLVMPLELPEIREDEDEIPTRVAGPPLEIRVAPDREAAESLEELPMEAEASPITEAAPGAEPPFPRQAPTPEDVLDALEAAETPLGAPEPAPSPAPPPPRPARGPGGAIGMAHELAVRVSHRPPEVPRPPEPPPPEPPAAAAAPPPAPPSPERVLLPFEERHRVWRHSDRPARGKRPLPDWSEAGDLAQTSVPRLLNAFYESRHTGELKLKQDTILKVVYVENGLPVYAASNLATERFGRFCVRHGALSEADLNRVAALSELEGIRTGESMVRLGLLTPERRRELLEEQVREIIWSTFGWTRGQYSLVPKKPSRQDLVKLELFPGELILEGVRRTRTLIALRQRMPPARRLIPAPDPPYQLQDLPLDSPRATLLAAADGSKTVEDLLALTDLSEREALASLVGLELLGVLVERRADEGKRQRISFGL